MYHTKIKSSQSFQGLFDFYVFFSPEGLREKNIGRKAHFFGKPPFISVDCRGGLRYTLLTCGHWRFFDWQFFFNLSTFCFPLTNFLPPLIYLIHQELKLISVLVS